MANAGWSTTVRTGNPQTDLQMVDQHRQHGAAQGLQVEVQPLPTGGYQVTARPPAGAAPPGVEIPAELGGTLPSASGIPAAQPFDPNRQSAYAVDPVPGYGMPPSPYAAPMPGPVVQEVDPAAQFGGTLPSVPGQGYGAPRPAPQVELHPSAQYPGWSEGIGECQACSRVGPTKSVTFMQNIGVIIIRFPKTISGHLCKFCVDKYAFEYTAITMLLGWWGVISFIYSVFAIPVNLFNWIRTIGMPPPPDDVQSLSDKKGRSLWLVLLSVPMLLVFLLWMLVSLSMMIDPDLEDGVVSGIVNVVSGLVFVGVPALLLAFFGIRGRMRASAGLRQMGAA